MNAYDTAEKYVETIMNAANKLTSHMEEMHAVIKAYETSTSFVMPDGTTAEDMIAEIANLNLQLKRMHVERSQVISVLRHVKSTDAYAAVKNVRYFLGTSQP